MAGHSSAGFEPWAFEIGRSHRDRHGRTDVRSGSSDRSAGIALTMSSCLASATSGTCSNHTKNITTKRARTYHFRRTRRSPAPCRPRSDVRRAHLGWAASPIYPSVSFRQGQRQKRPGGSTNNRRPYLEIKYAAIARAAHSMLKVAQARPLRNLDSLLHRRASAT